MVAQASRLKNVRYDIRGPVLRRAQELEAAGHRSSSSTSATRRRGAWPRRSRSSPTWCTTCATAQGYSDARGIYSARVAVAQYYQTLGVTDVQPDDVLLGNGVSELIVMSLQALLNTGDEVLVPSPDYPLWTGAVTLCGGRPVHYRCDESRRAGARPRARRRADHRRTPGPW